MVKSIFEKIDFSTLHKGHGHFLKWINKINFLIPLQLYNFCMKHFSIRAF